MRLKITAVTDQPCLIPYNYQYQMQSALYRLFQKSDADFSKFLHHIGYGNDAQYRFKLFTFSRISPFPYHTNKQGFFLVKKIEFIFATASDKNLEHLMHGIFPDAELILQFQDIIKFRISNVELIPESVFNDDFQKFSCLSPIVVSTQREINGKIKKQYLNYFVPAEKELWLKNLKINLLRKYEILTEKTDTIVTETSFHLQFDPEYVTTAGRSLKKMVKINNTSVFGLFAPFVLKCPQFLKSIAYDTGLGEQNSAGFGCLELVE